MSTTNARAPTRLNIVHLRGLDFDPDPSQHGSMNEQCLKCCESARDLAIAMPQQICSRRAQAIDPQTTDRVRSTLCARCSARNGPRHDYWIYPKRYSTSSSDRIIVTNKSRTRDNRTK